MGPAKQPPRRSKALRMHIRDLSLTPVNRYVDIQRQRGRIIAIDKVDIDIEQLVERKFLCDRHRCIQWTPHEKKKDAKPIIDNSCRSRYLVPVTDLDRHKLAEILPLVRKRLARNHPLREDEATPPYQIESDFAFVMRDQEGGACQFVLYDGGLTSCAIHKTCLEEGLDPWEYKPLGCSLWPVALIDYDDDGQQRYLLTVYANATAGLFVDAPDTQHEDEAHFACLVDQDPSYDPLYKSMEGLIVYALGPEFYQKLDAKARKYLSRT